MPLQYKHFWTQVFYKNFGGDKIFSVNMVVVWTFKNILISRYHHIFTLLPSVYVYHELIYDHKIIIYPAKTMQLAYNDNIYILSKSFVSGKGFFTVCEAEMTTIKKKQVLKSIKIIKIVISEIKTTLYWLTMAFWKEKYLNFSLIFCCNKSK